MSLVSIQNKLKCNKSQYNSFGKYYYRNCEDILEAAKPILAEFGATLTIHDDIVMVGQRIYVKATVTLTIKDQEYVCTAFAREAEDKKGLDLSQITGASSSYARKYALNGLFLIDDTKDADAHDNSKQTAKPTTQTINDSQLANLEILIEQTNTDIAQFCKYVKVKELHHLPAADYNPAIKALEGKKGKM
jgi:hypothetical protein